MEGPKRPFAGLIRLLFVSDVPPPSYSNYPRPHLGQDHGSEYLRPPGIHFESITDAWSMISKDFSSWIAYSLVGMALVMVVTVPTSLIGSMVQNGGSLISTAPPELPNIIMGMLINLLGGVLVYPVMAGMYYAALTRIRGGQLNIPDLFVGFKHFAPMLVFGILNLLGVYLGAIFCIIPGLFLFSAWIFSPLLIVDKGLAPLDAMKSSWKALGSDVWMMILLYIVLSIVASLGFIACCVGILVTWPILFIGIALHYHYYFDQPMPAAFVPEPTSAPASQ